MTVPDRVSASRIARLDAYLADRDLRAVWFADPASFAWLTGGSNAVVRSSEVGVAAAGYVRDPVHANTAADRPTPDGEGSTSGGEVRVVTDNVEAGRLVAEELPDGVAVEAVPWHEASLAEAVAAHSPAPAAADFDIAGFESVDPTDLRQPLTDADVEAYRALGADAAEAVESVCRLTESDDTELEVATGADAALSARDVRASVVLVGGEERAQRYRHYTPRNVELGGYALVSVTAERGGLHASLTRTVALDPPTWLRARHEAAMRVEASALAATRRVARVGGVSGDVFDAVRDAYERVGWPDEWREHHQGGAAGYAGREWIATPSGSETVYAPMAYAWNPTVQGAKSEDTVLVTEEGFEILTTTGQWPVARVDAADGDAAVDRHRVLSRST